MIYRLKARALIHNNVINETDTIQQNSTINRTHFIIHVQKNATKVYRISSPHWNMLYIVILRKFMPLGSVARIIIVKKIIGRNS
jgi:hypothetical protein